MSKLSKCIRKDMKKFSKQLNSEKGLMIKKTFDMTAAIYGNGKENKPYFTISKKGDFKISVFKLLVIMTLVISTLALVMLCAKGYIEHFKSIKSRRAEKTDEYRDEDWV